MIDALLAVLIGLVAGVLSGLFGIGGGVVITPAIRLILERPELIAVGTPLLVVVPGAVAGALTHLRTDRTALYPGMVIGAWGAVASVLGAWFATIIGGRWVLAVTAGVILFVAVDMAVRTLRPPVVDARRAFLDVTALTPARRAMFGVITGAYAGTLGLGGGIVLVPLLTRFGGLPIKRAVPVSLVSIALIAIPGSIAHWRLGNVDTALAAILILGAVPGAIFGARISMGSSERAMRLGFSALLLATGLALAAVQLGLA